MPNLTIVLDIGQFSSKCGFSGEDNPSMIFFTMVGTPKYHGFAGKFTKQEQDLYVGDEIQSLGLYKIEYPIQEGKITDWKFFERIIDYIFYNLRVDPTLVNVLFAIHPLFPKQDIERLFHLFLEHYQCMAFYPVLDSMLTLYSGGFQTGLVVEIGDSSTRIIPIYEGYKLSHAIKIVNIGGRTLTKYMGDILKDSIGFNVESSIRKELVRAIKEKACFLSLDYNEDLKRSEQYKKQYSLPDGATINLSKERFIVPELLFNPSSELESDPLHKIILDVIEECDLDIRPKLLNNIFLSGGSSMFPNMKARLYQELELELTRRKKQYQSIRIMAPRERIYSVWTGGSILAMIPEFSNTWVTRAKYFDQGIPEELL
ncbi:MAG: actin family protein [Candidatus Lokiarchaeota archaeon]|nr:actin family protein [Candidatus Lokiarchaeota archaeon]